MAWQDEMMKAMSDFVSKRVGREVVVDSYEDTRVYVGGCETCAFDYAAIDFYSQGEKVYQYEGNFVEFMERLTS